MRRKPLAARQGRSSWLLVPTTLSLAVTAKSPNVAANSLAIWETPDRSCVETKKTGFSNIMWATPFQVVAREPHGVPESTELLVASPPPASSATSPRLPNVWTRPP